MIGKLGLCCAVDGGYQKSCMTLSTLYLENYRVRVIVYHGHAGFVVSAAENVAVTLMEPEPE